MPKSTGNWIKEATAVLIFVLLVALIFPFRWNHKAYFNNSIDLLGTCLLTLFYSLGDFIN